MRGIADHAPEEPEEPKGPEEKRSAVSVRFEAALRKSSSEGVRIALVAFVTFQIVGDERRSERVAVSLGDILRDAGINAADVAAYMKRIDEGQDVSGFDS